jgi:hypothetical protein
MGAYDVLSGDGNDGESQEQVTWKVVVSAKEQEMVQKQSVTLFDKDGGELTGEDIPADSVRRIEYASPLRRSSRWRSWLGSPLISP